MKRRVVITGYGVICPIGVSIENFWENCLAGNINIQQIPRQWRQYSDYFCDIWSPLPEIDYEQFGFSPAEVKQHDPANLIAMMAAFEALRTAGLKYEAISGKNKTYLLAKIESRRTGVFLGTGVGGLTSLMSSHSYQLLAHQRKDLKKLATQLKGLSSASEQVDSLNPTIERCRCPLRFNPFVVSMSMPNSSSSFLGIKLHLNGPNRTFCSSCASGTVAIGQAYRAIQQGEIDVALAGGVEYLYDDYGSIFRGFDIIKALTNGYDDPSLANRPFDKRRTGFLFSQGGAGILVLEELEHAKIRGAKIESEVLSYAETCDAFSMMVLEENGESIKDMLCYLLREAGLSPADIDYINAHGTGTVVNDNIESMVIEELFGKRVLVNSTKSLIGHTIGASGAIEAIVTVLSIKHKKTHICKNLADPVRELNFTTEVKSSSINRAISQSFGFGGHNAALLLSEYTG